jgi:hypothetical protein
MSMSITHQMLTVAAMRTERTNCTLNQDLLAPIAHANPGRHCTQGDVEVSLARAGVETEGHSESSTSSSSSAVGEAVNCHSHAGVE